MIAHKRVALAAGSIAAAALIVAPFVARPGLPGLRQDWIWPQDGSGLIHWFLSGQSAWHPDGFGGALGSPTVNVVLASFAALAAVGLSTKIILALFLIACYSLAHAGMWHFLEETDLPLHGGVAWLLGATYAYGPVMFQKTVAGHLYFICAYALLPWFALLVWRACGDSPGRLRAALAAGLIAAISSAQIQFLFFDAFLALVIALARPCRRRNLGYAAVAVVIALVHNAVLVVNTPGIEQSGLLLQHATAQWERDLSGPLFALAPLGGYEHYAFAALAPSLHGVYAFGRFCVLALGILGVGLSVWKRRHRRLAIAFAVVAIAGLLMAVGWDGPLEPALSYALNHTVMFTIFRELYHFMALYAFGLMVLIACAIALLPARVRVPCALITLLAGLPFFTMGLQRAIPSVPAAAFDERCAAANLFALLPDQEPVALLQDADHGGLDPARFLPGDGVAGSEPVAVKWALAAAENGDLTPLRAMGFGCIKWRPRVVSRLPAGFEPNTGADFTQFIRSQRKLRKLSAAPLEIPNARALVSLESANYHGALDDGLADAQVPPGKEVPVTYSFADNDIRSNWVWGRMWSWSAPGLMRVSSDPVLTRAKEISYDAAMPSGSWSHLYILAAAQSVRNGGVPGNIVPFSARGPYRWYRWTLEGDRKISLRFKNARALARIVVSSDGFWTPNVRANRGGERRPMPSAVRSMWSIDGSLPAFARGSVVVFARLFSPGWHLLVAGKDLGPAHRVHGLFNGWNVLPADSGKAITITYVPQLFYWWLNGVATLIQLAALALVFWPRALALPSVLRAHRVARKHV